MVAKIGRNEPCPCGSGLKYKKCCDKPVTLRLTATQMVICLLRQLGGKATVELEEVANIADTCIDIDQQGNSVHLSVIESEEKGVILTLPEQRIISQL